VNAESFILRKTIADSVERSRQIARVVEELEGLPHNATWRVSIEQVKSSRSTEANAYYWGVVVSAISERTGYEPEEVHEYICGSHWGWKDKRVPKTPRNPLGVESVPLRTTTTNEHGKRAVLGKMAFWEFVEFARRFAAEKLGLVVPDPDPAYRETQRVA
jgi:hypothetical protein